MDLWLRHLKQVVRVKSGFLQVGENWKKSGNLSGQGKVGEIFFLEKSGKMKIGATRC